MNQANTDRPSRGDGHFLTDQLQGPAYWKRGQRLLACQNLEKLKSSQGIHVLRLSLGRESLVDRRGWLLCAIKPYSHSSLQPPS